MEDNDSKTCMYIACKSRYALLTMHSERPDLQLDQPCESPDPHLPNAWPSHHPVQCPHPPACVPPHPPVRLCLGGGWCRRGIPP